MNLPQYELNISDYLRIIRKRKSIIIVSFVLVTALSLFYVSKQKAWYEAVTTVKIAERKTIAGLLAEWIAYNPGNIMESETKLITGFPVMKKVVLRLKMVDENAADEDIFNAIAQVQGGVSAKTFKDTNIIEIIARSDNAKKAMELANMVAGVYVEENLLEKNKQASTARKFIEEQLSSLDEKLRKNEEGLKTFGEEVKGIRGSSAIQEKLVQLEFELQSLLQKYTHKHPAVRQLKDQMKELEEQQKGFSGRELEYARLQREVEVGRKLYAMLKEKLEEARINEAQRVSDVSVVDPAVVPSAPMNHEKKAGVLLSGLLGIILGIILAFVFESLDTSIGTIEDVERLTSLPVLGVVPLISSQLQEKEEEEAKGIVERFLRHFFASHQPKADERYVRLIVHHEPRSVITESYRTIRTNLKLNPSLRTILVTSAQPSEGKTSVLTNLGLMIAQTGAKILLVSTDLRRPTLAETFGIKREPGLNEVVNKSVTLDAAIRGISDIMLGDLRLDKIMESPGIENIHILASGSIPVNPAELLMSKEMQSLIGELKRRFDIILMDSPPVLPISDANLLASKVDGIILVYEAGRTARSALLRAKIQLESAGAKILGVVLNHIRVRTDLLMHPPGYYKYRYHEKPSEKNGKPEK